MFILTGHMKMDVWTLLPSFTGAGSGNHEGREIYCDKCIDFY